MRGETIPDHVSMTGTINPDSTIGPVGGIAFKLLGAKDAGITRFALPLGKRYNTNLCTGEKEDVVALGRSLGLEIAEVGDVREAFAFLTGIPLPAAPLRPVSMAIPDDIRVAYRQLFAQWEERYDAARRIIASAHPRELPEELEKFWRHAIKLAAARSNLEYVDALYTARQATRQKKDIESARPLSAHAGATPRPCG